MYKSFLDLIKLTLPLKHLYYILENETYTIEIKVKQKQIFMLKNLSVLKGVYR